MIQIVDQKFLLVNNFKLKNFFFGAANVVRNREKSKYVYSGYGVAFYGVGSWSFGNDFARNVVIFGFENSSSSHPDDCKNNILVLGEGPTDYINGNFGAVEQVQY